MVPNSTSTANLLYQRKDLRKTELNLKCFDRLFCFKFLKLFSHYFDTVYYSFIIFKKQKVYVLQEHETMIKKIVSLYDQRCRTEFPL